jgi:hypothetical protein
MNRELDVKVTRLLGLDVLGEARCYSMPGGYSVSWDEGGGEMQPVYLKECFCDDPLENEIEILGHVASCLRVVSFYSSECNLAIAALEQVCDERGLSAMSLRAYGTWFTRVWKEDDPHYRVIAASAGREMSLAICRALAGLK